ncbi:MAG TPA: hypothetical protein DCY79_07450 [Planctomycetaceae bacterium]|nr:hypothetical protein [Blastopirellula sp.]HAY79625.1 hypothetical protein [Planctomycetaceae bacterium]|tara:strand:+ start:231 stop:659 length:429 start_codon:yes stop_codon:yes gene_type:complete
MKLSSRKIERNKHVELTMTSMIDVVFLLLIFFMVFSSFLDTERNLDSAIKVKKSSSANSSDLERAIVEVVRQGDIAIYRVGSRAITDEAELRRILEQFPNKADGAFVRVEDGVPFGMAATAVQACKSADFLAVSYIPIESSN